MKLVKNDAIGIIAPSGEVKEPQKLDDAKKLFEENGFKVKIFPSCYSARSDKERLDDLHSAFLDDEIKAIICARGGYGTLRIVDDINYELIADYPKIFAGSSDITVLLLNLYRRSSFKIYHSPMALNGFNDEVMKDFLNTVNEETKNILPRSNYKTLIEGRAFGTLWGGNLATVVSMFGSEPKTYIPKEDIVLFLEDLNEPVYKIDKMLRQIYRNKELKERIKGIVFGDFLDAGEGLENTLLEYARLFKVPVGYGYAITHLKPNLTIPIGQNVEFNSTNGHICFS